jgi:hypothetical protein
MNTTEKEFLEAIGTEPEGINNKNCGNCTNRVDSLCSNLFCKDNSIQDCLNNGHKRWIGRLPKITAEIRERLEELARQKDFQKNIRFGESVAENEFMYSFVTGKDVSPYVIHAYGKNRSDALLSLMTKLVKDGIIEGSKVREVFE